MRERLRLGRAIAFGIAAILAIVLAIFVVPPNVLRDAQPSASLAPFVDAARGELRSQAIEGPFFWWPLHLRFVEARCSTMPRGRVAFVFEEWRPPYLGTTYAVAMRGSMPTAPDDSWGGGLGMRSVYDDDEFLFQMGTNTVACT